MNNWDGETHTPQIAGEEKKLPGENETNKIEKNKSNSTNHLNQMLNTDELWKQIERKYWNKK